MGATPGNSTGAIWRYECIDRESCRWLGYRRVRASTPCPRCRGPVRDVTMRLLGEANLLPPGKKRQQVTCNVMPTTLERLQKIRDGRTLAMTAASVLDEWAQGDLSIHAIALEQTARLSMMSAELEGLKKKKNGKKNGKKKR